MVAELHMPASPLEQQAPSPEAVSLLAFSGLQSCRPTRLSQSQSLNLCSGQAALSLSLQALQGEERGQRIWYHV